MRTHTLTSIAIAAVVIVAPGATPAQSGFPSGPITMIVSAPPRDNLTSIHRELADIAGAELGVEIKVENKPGSGGREGVEALIEAAPDGHTIAAVWNAPLTIAPHTGAASYTIDDIVPIMRTTAGAPLVVCVHPGFRRTTAMTSSITLKTTLANTAMAPTVPEGSSNLPEVGCSDPWASI